MDLAVVSDRSGNATLVRNTEEGNVTRDRVQRTDLDSGAGLNRDGAEGAVTEVIGHVVAAVRAGAFVVVTARSGDQREGKQHGKQHHELA